MYQGTKRREEARHREIQECIGEENCETGCMSGQAEMIQNEGKIGMILAVGQGLQERVSLGVVRLRAFEKRQGQPIACLRSLLVSSKLVEELTKESAGGRIILFIEGLASTVEDLFR